MKYFESVKDNPELMVMLHGGGTSHLGMLATAKEMAHVYHVVIVAQDGFNPDELEMEFVSPMDEAKRLGDYIVAHYGDKIDILYGRATWRSWKNQDYALIGKKNRLLLV